MTQSVPTRRRRASLVALATLALTSMIAAGGVGSAMAQDAPEPQLTWAPLVTLPPIAPPTVVSPAELASGYTLGDPDAPVAIEVWEDFQCPFCRLFSEQVKPYLVETYVEPGKASLTFRHLAFLGEESRWAAVAADLAAEQDLFWPFHDYLFANQVGENKGGYELDRLLAMAEASGLDMAAFRAGLVLDAARERFARIDTESRQDAGALGINGTPSLVLDGELLKFESFDQAIAAIDEAVAAAEGAGAEATETPSEVEPGATAPDAEQPAPAASPAG